MKSIFHKATNRAMESFAGSLFVLTSPLSGNAFGLWPFTLCRCEVEIFALWCGASSCTLALCRCGCKSVLLPDVSGLQSGL